MQNIDTSIIAHCTTIIIIVISLLQPSSYLPSGLTISSERMAEPWLEEEVKEILHDVLNELYYSKAKKEKIRSS